MKRLFCIFLLWVLVCGSAVAQFTDRVWCFGDSAGLNFNTPGNIPAPFKANHLAKGSCVSICNANSNLLFYAYTQSGLIGPTTRVVDSSFNTMSNGTNIIGEGWYNELIILPNPGDSNLFYLFTTGIVGSPEGLYCSIIDKSLNNGLGSVTQKNILISNTDYFDGMIGVRHGNGRDWWLILHYWNGSNTFEEYLITPAGISNAILQPIGINFDAGLGEFVFSYQTNKFLSVTLSTEIQVLDFDRCTGLFSNPVTIQNGGFSAYGSVGCSIAPNGRLVYISNTNNFSDSLRLYQYDLTAPNINQSRQTIYKQKVPASGGFHAVGPDGKIYISCLYEYGYPYADSIHNIYSDNLSVINYPDSIGLACDFQPFSVNLGGQRTYWGLPNNPNYEAGSLVGSPCDTLVGMGESPQIQQATLNVFYHTAWEKAFINASNLKGENGNLFVYDMQGKIIHQEPLRIQNGYYTRDLSMEGKVHGVYLVIVQTEKERLTRKMIME
jgi:hypothetical protein